MDNKRLYSRVLDKVNCLEIYILQVHITLELEADELPNIRVVYSLLVFQRNFYSVFSLNIYENPKDHQCQY